MRNLIFIGLLIAIFFVYGCSSSSDSHVTQYDTGIAELYSETDHGIKILLDNEHYDRYKFTAAHRSLPKNSKVKVTNLGNGRRTEVIINDRDLSDDCIIKLSNAAANELKISITKEITVSVEMLGY